MSIRGLVRRAGLAAAVFAASFLIIPSAFARVHVGLGISVPGVAIGVGNCWRCGYPPPPVYYQPAYVAPAYYPAPVYYAPRPVYNDYGYDQPHYRYHRWHHRRDRDDYYRRYRDHEDDDD